MPRTSCRDPPCTSQAPRKTSPARVATGAETERARSRALSNVSTISARPIRRAIGRRLRTRRSHDARQRTRARRHDERRLRSRRIAGLREHEEAASARIASREQLQSTERHPRLVRPRRTGAARREARPPRARRIVRRSDGRRRRRGGERWRRPRRGGIVPRRRTSRGSPPALRASAAALPCAASSRSRAASVWLRRSRSARWWLSARSASPSEVVEVTSAACTSASACVRERMLVAGAFGFGRELA